MPSLREVRRLRLAEARANLIRARQLMNSALNEVIELQRLDEEE